MLRAASDLVRLHRRHLQCGPDLTPNNPITSRQDLNEKNPSYHAERLLGLVVRGRTEASTSVLSDSKTS